jgi:fructokinase
MKKPSIVCFGEMLWDILPSGKMPGGAPKCGNPSQKL